MLRLLDNTDVTCQHGARRLAMCHCPQVCWQVPVVLLVQVTTHTKPNSRICGVQYPPYLGVGERRGYLSFINLLCFPSTHLTITLSSILVTEV